MLFNGVESRHSFCFGLQKHSNPLKALVEDSVPGPRVLQTDCDERLTDEGKSLVRGRENKSTTKLDERTCLPFLAREKVGDHPAASHHTVYHYKVSKTSFLDNI